MSIAELALPSHACFPLHSRLTFPWKTASSLAIDTWGPDIPASFDDACENNRIPFSKKRDLYSRVNTWLETEDPVLSTDMKQALLDSLFEETGFEQSGSERSGLFYFGQDMKNFPLFLAAKGIVLDKERIVQEYRKPLFHHMIQAFSYDPKTYISPLATLLAINPANTLTPTTVHTTIDNLHPEAFHGDATIRPEYEGWLLHPDAENRLMKALTTGFYGIYGPLVVKYDGNCVGMCYKTANIGNKIMVAGGWYAPVEDTMPGMVLDACFTKASEKPFLTGTWVALRGISSLPLLKTVRDTVRSLQEHPFEKRIPQEEVKNLCLQNVVPNGDTPLRY